MAKEVVARERNRASHMAAVAEVCTPRSNYLRADKHICLGAYSAFCFHCSQSLEKQLLEAQADLVALGGRREATEGEEQQLREDLTKLSVERERIDVSVRS